MKKWLPFMLAAGVTMGLGAYWYHTRTYDAAQLMQCLPQERSLHIYLDLGLLRSAGILDLLAGAKGSEEADYKEFVQDTGFDYRTDLAAVAASYRDGNYYFAVRGRFNSDKLNNYAQSHGGACEVQICSMPASTQGRYISFTLLRRDVLALAVGGDKRGADFIAPGIWKEPPRIPPVVLWISAPPFVFADANALPTGTKPFLSPLADARDTTFTLGPTNDGKSFEVKMDAEAMTPDDATKMAAQFVQFTDLLKKMIQRDNLKPDSGNPASVLMAGHFETQKEHVIGQWPIERAFLDSLVSGKIE